MQKAGKKIRLAVVKATGEKFMVQQIDFERRKVYVWGNVTGYKNLKTTHQKGRIFLLDAVEIQKDVEKTLHLQDELMEQTFRSFENNPKVERVIRRGRNYEIVWKKAV